MNSDEPPLPDQNEIYLVRHGQTEWNLEGRLQGSKDSPLTSEGERQAASVASCLKEIMPTFILASPLGRASRTAEIISKTLGIRAENDERLGEMRFGKAEGLTLAQIDEHWQDFRGKREQDKWNTRWPGGECYDDVDQRLASLFLDEISDRLDRPDAGPLAIVGHETTNMILLGRLLRLDPSIVIRLGQPNNVIYRLCGRLVDHGYLGDDTLNWIPGLLQKRSDEILHIAA